MRKAFSILCSTLLVGILSTACKQDLTFDQYAHTPIAGWEKNDALFFDIPPCATSGIYQEELGLRITGDYPFMGLTLIVQQTIYPDKTVRTDTVNCRLIDQNGKTTGQGISYYQYNFPLCIQHLNKGDSIHVAVRHDMKREIMPGISDIGLKMFLVQAK